MKRLRRGEKKEMGDIPKTNPGLSRLKKPLFNLLRGGGVELKATWRLLLRSESRLRGAMVAG